ncbi:MAG: hypothetical protein JXQ65_02420 [Candidatus Marinimicrobia bacterium]|nr:hypothetical protein [Candidatus Neomarinimicrobiota bacterium]
MANDPDCETSVLWDDISDIIVKNDKTLSTVIQEIINSNLSLSKSTKSSLVAELDTLGSMQMFIHNFDVWDGQAELLTSYTPLDQNDIDVQYLTIYDDMGVEYELDVNNFTLTRIGGSLSKTTATDEPILIIGENEDNSTPNDNPVISGSFKIVSVKVTKDAMDYEP